MVDISVVRRALEEVMDPEIQRPLGDIGAVREVDVDGSTARVVVGLAVPGSPLIDDLGDSVTAALSAVEGIQDVEV